MDVAQREAHGIDSTRADRPFKKKAARTKRKTCCLCGGTIAVFYPGRRSYGRDAQHDLCRRCWQASRDKMRALTNNNKEKESRL
jgi:hypothetical protein